MTVMSIKRIKLFELAQLGWIEVLAPEIVAVTEQSSGTHGRRLLGSDALTLSPAVLPSRPPTLKAGPRRCICGVS